MRISRYLLGLGFLFYSLSFCSPSSFFCLLFCGLVPVVGGGSKTGRRPRDDEMKRLYFPVWHGHIYRAWHG